MYNNLAGVYQAQGNNEEALKCYRKCLKICDMVLGEDQSYIAEIYHNMGLLLYNMESYEEAHIYLCKALSIYEKMLGPDYLVTELTREDLKNVEKAVKE